MTIANRKKLLSSLVSILGSFLLVHLCHWILPGVFEIWNAQTTDQLYLLRSSMRPFRLSYDPTVAYLDINDSTIQRLGGPYVSRSHLAQVIRNLATMGVSAQVYDMIFAGPIEEHGDRALIEASADAGNVYFGLALRLSGESSPRQPPLLAHPEVRRLMEKMKWDPIVQGETEAFYAGLPSLTTFAQLGSVARGLGHLNAQFDRDGVLRRVPLLIGYERAFFPSLPFRVACDYLGIRQEEILVKPGKHLVLKTGKTPEGAHPASNILVPIDRQGNVVINYIGPWESMDHYSFADVLFASDDPRELELWKKELKGRIILVSDVSTGSGDTGRVPTDTNYPFSGAHVNLLNSILTHSFLRELSKSEMLVIEGVLMVSVLLLSLRFSSVGFPIFVLGAGFLYLGGAAVSFLYGHVILNLVRPVLMVGLALVAIVIQSYMREEREKLESLRQRDFVRATFGRYLSNEVVDQILDSREGLNMGGENREVTLLFSDLRGFTALASRLAPQQVIPILNRYFEAMVEIVAAYRGTVDEFQGDGMLVFFGAPFRAEDDAERAVSCAIAMQNKMAEINERNRREGLPELSMGIGINTGEVIVGNIGSEKRTKYGAVGTAINMAHRIQSHAKGGQILIGPYTRDKVGERVQVRAEFVVSFKGIDGPVRIHDVVRIEGEYRPALGKMPPHGCHALPRRTPS